MGLLYYISYFAVLAAFAFVTLSLASGLLYISELIEEHSRLAKIIGQRGIYVIILLHVLFYFFDSLPLGQILFSVVCHAVYLQNFSQTWPIISLTSPSFLASCVLVISDHFMWFFYFAQKTNELRHTRTYRGPPPDTPGFTEIASFFGLCVWLAPLFLFLSLSANDNALPTSSAEPGSPSSSAETPHYTQSRVSLIRSILSFFSVDKIPRFRPKPARKGTADGLIAPSTPNPQRSPMSNYVSTPPTSRPTTPSYGTPPPPRSPGPRLPGAQELDVHLSRKPNFKLGVPPRRSPGPVRRVTVDSTGLGLRRASGLKDDELLKVE